MPGIICLEGNWNEKDLTKENSVAPILQYLSTNMNIKVIHKHCSTVEQLEYYFNLLSEQRKYRHYDIIYMAFHGSSGNIYLDKLNYIPVDDLITLSLSNKKRKKGFFEDRKVHFGSCTTLKNESISEDFIKRTGAKLASGFIKKIDFNESAAFDLLYLGKLAYKPKYNMLIDTIIKDHENFVRQLGFVSYSRAR